MGSFSWYTSDTGRAIRMDNPFPVYALRPDGEPLLEMAYDGYGIFGGKDICELVADWNREYLANHPEFLIPQHGYAYFDDLGGYLPAKPKRVDEFAWYPLYADLTKTAQEIEREMLKTETFWEYRFIGSDISAYDDQNIALPFPIKLVEYPVPYAIAKASFGDPEQGGGEKDRFVNQEETLSEILANAERRSQQTVMSPEELWQELGL